MERAVCGLDADEETKHSTEVNAIEAITRDRVLIMTGRAGCK